MRYNALVMASTQGLFGTVIRQAAGRILALLCAASLFFGGMALAQTEAESQLRSQDSKERERAARSLGESGNRAYIPALAGVLQDPDAKVRSAVVKSLIRLGGGTSLPPLCKAVQDGYPEIRLLALDGIVNYYLPGYVDTGFGGLFRSVGSGIQNMFSDVDTTIADADTKVSPEVLATLKRTVTGSPDMNTRVRAARAIGILHVQEAVPELMETVFGNNVDLTSEALRAFQKIKDTSVGPRLVFLLGYPQRQIQQRAATTLGLLRTQEAIPELQRLLSESPDKNVQAAALESLAFMPRQDTVPLFVKFLDDRDDKMRISAALGLGRLKNPGNLPVLEVARSKERDAGVRLAIAFAMVEHGKLEYLDELMAGLESRVHRGEAQPYLVEVAREQKVRDALYPKLYSEPTEVRKQLCTVLGASGNSSSISYLEVLLKDRDAEVVQEASRAIRILRSRGM